MIDALKSDEIVNKVGGRFKLTALIQKRMLELMAMDKKVKGGRIRLVLLDGIGRAAVADDYPREALEDLLAERAGA